MPAAPPDLRRLLPQTLLARTFLLVSLALVVTVASWLALFRVAEREPRAQQLAQLTASVVNLTRTAMVVADPARRHELLFELMMREAIRLYPWESSDQIQALPDTPFYRAYIRETRILLGADTELALMVNGQAGLWVRFLLDENNGGDEDRFWVVLPEERTQRQIPALWLAWGIISLVLALLITWLIVSRVTRPLRALAERAGEVGAGRHPEPLAESGSRELRQLAHAFNQMADNLRRTDRERAEVLAGISHDLRTPLARLRLEAELSVADAGARDAINADIDQMDGVIGQFLDYARGESGEAVVDTDVVELLSRVVEQRRRRGCAVDIATPLPDSLALALRPKAVARAIGNLLDNAEKYGAAPFALACTLIDDGCCIDVLDRGPGIPEHEVERVKRPFARLEAARTDARGTGLGLAIVDRVARLHGGSLELLPRSGGGLCARMTLRRTGNG